MVGDQRNLAVSANDISIRKPSYNIKIIESTERLTAWGLPMTSSLAEQGNLAHVTKPSFTVSGWYYSCKDASFTVFCKQDATTGPTETTYMCLEVETDSSFIITLMLSGVETLYQVKGFKAASGWTWFSISVQEVYGKSVVSFYAAHDSYTGLASPPPAKTEKVTLSGYYTDPVASPNIKIYFGCRRNMRGVCYRSMLGYFFHFKIWAAQALTPAQLGSEITTTCGSAACGVCHTDGKCFSQRSLIIYELDLEQDTQLLTS